MTCLTNAGVYASDVMQPSKMAVLPNSLCAETATNSAVMTPVSAEVIDIDTMLSVSSTFPLVKPVESDAQQFSPIQKRDRQFTRNGIPLRPWICCRNGNYSNTASRHKRRSSLWSRAKRLTR